MGDKVLLDVFRLADSFKLPVEEIMWRAEDCAKRHAELCGWKDIEISLSRCKLTTDPREYMFEIWSYGEK